MPDRFGTTSRQGGGSLRTDKLVDAFNIDSDRSWRCKMRQQQSHVHDCERTLLKCACRLDSCEFFATNSLPRRRRVRAVYFINLIY